MHVRAHVCMHAQIVGWMAGRKDGWMHAGMYVHGMHVFITGVAKPGLSPAITARTAWDFSRRDDRRSIYVCTFSYVHIHKHIYIYTYTCVCVCVCMRTVYMRRCMVCDYA